MTKGKKVMDDFSHVELRRAEDLAEADGGEPADREGILAAGDRFTERVSPCQKGT